MHTPGGNPPKCGYESWLSATESLQQDVYAVCGILLATGEINMGNRVTQFCLRALPILLMMLGIAFLLFCVIQFWNLRDGVNDKTALGKLLSQGRATSILARSLISTTAAPTTSRPCSCTCLQSAVSLLPYKAYLLSLTFRTSLSRQTTQ